MSRTNVTFAIPPDVTSGKIFTPDGVEAGSWDTGNHFPGVPPIDSYKKPIPSVGTVGGEGVSPQGERYILAIVGECRTYVRLRVQIGSPHTLINLDSKYEWFRTYPLYDDDPIPFTSLHFPADVRKGGRTWVLGFPPCSNSGICHNCHIFDACRATPGMGYVTLYFYRNSLGGEITPDSPPDAWHAIEATISEHYGEWYEWEEWGFFFETGHCYLGQVPGAGLLPLYAGTLGLLSGLSGSGGAFGAAVFMPFVLAALQGAFSASAAAAGRVLKQTDEDVFF